MNKIGIICGRGLAKTDFAKGLKKAKTETPYGLPSSGLFKGEISGMQVVLIFRHGEKEEIPAFKVNHRANIYALQQEGCMQIVATSTCSSLREEINAGEIMVLSQFIDNTRKHELTFSDNSEGMLLHHDPITEPFDGLLRNKLIEAAVTKGITIHTKATVITIDGPRQSTRAESNLYRQWNGNIVNMSTAPEAILTNELGLTFAVVALCTGFDSWRTDIQHTTAEEEAEIIRQNKHKVADLLREFLVKIKESQE